MKLSGNTAQLLKKAAKHPVTETPDGELKEFSLNTEYYDPNMDEWITRDGIKSYGVIDGSTVWIKDIGTTYKFGTWIKGEISADKKHVVFDNMQPYYEDADGNLYYISHSYTNANQDVIADTESDSFSFDYDEQTGTISNDTLELSIVNGDGGVFSYSVGYAYTPFTDKLVEVPAGLTFQSYSLRYDNAYKYYVPTLISVAWQGNNFYFKGLSTKTPNSVLKGTLQGDSIVINNGQYVGLYDDQYYLYFKGARYTSLDSDGWPIYKSKDHAALTVSKNAAGEYQFDGKDGILFCLGKKANASYSQSYPAQTMRIFHGAPATPKTPDISGWEIDDTYKTTTTMSYIVPIEDVDGNYINPESLKNNAASIADDMDDVMAKVGDEVTVTANLKNLGANGVKSIGYTYDMNGTTKEGSVTLGTPIQNIYNGDGTATLSLGKPETEGTQEITIKLTKVNGVANENTSKVKATVNVIALAQSANRKTLVEVYNDKQKPNSPRAFVGMEKLKEALDDSVVILNIHMSDSFAVASYKERASDSRYYSAPIAEVDRMTLTDPYYGNATAAPYHFTADKVVSPYLKRISEAELGVKANWTDDNEDSVSITATTKFLMSSSSAYYRLGFAVIKDSITAGQYNYITYYKSSYPDDDMAYWCAQPYSTTAVNNNLVVASSDASGIEKSVPRKVVKDEELTYNYGLKVPVVNGQKGVNARIVVFLVNTNTREVVNANVAEIQSAAATGIKQAIAATDNGLTRVYSMGGSLVATGKDLSSLRLQPGLYIVLQGGKTSKMLVK